MRRILAVCFAVFSVAAAPAPHKPPPKPPLDQLFADLAQAQSPEDAKPIEERIYALFEQSGSASIDLLMARGTAALAADDDETAKKLFAEWPTPIYSVSPELGAAIRFPGASIDKEFTTINPDNPLIPAYRAYQPMPYDTPAAAMAATLYAARPKEGYFNVSNPGSIALRDDGRTVFTASAQGTHYNLTVNPDKQEKVVQTFVELASAKPVIPQRFRPPVADDKKDEKKEDKKPDPPVQ